MKNSDIIVTANLIAITDTLKVNVSVVSTDYKTGNKITKIKRVFNPIYHNYKYRCALTGKLYQIIAGKEKLKEIN